MQQTEKYKLNLIESSDPFLPDGLNANTQKIEDAMAAHEAKVDGAVDALDERIKVFEAKKFAYGYYKCNSESNRFINVGFTPVAVVICPQIHAGNWGFYFAGANGTSENITIGEGGFYLDIKINASGAQVYFAFG